jgi:hypothetical protein
LYIADAIFCEKPPVDDFACKCTKAYNPWHKPDKDAEHTVPMNRFYYYIGIKSRSDLIVIPYHYLKRFMSKYLKVNGRYRFPTQNGSAWFERYCSVSLFQENLLSYFTFLSIGKNLFLNDNFNVQK